MQEQMVPPFNTTKDIVTESEINGKCEWMEYVIRENQHGTFGRLVNAICTILFGGNTNNQIDDDYLEDREQHFSSLSTFRTFGEKIVRLT